MRTSLEPENLATAMSEEVGLEFEASSGTDAEGELWYLLRPRGLHPDHAFGIRATVGWRRLRIGFEPGKFAGSLLVDMGNTDADGRSAFLAVLEDCRRLGAQIILEINGSPVSFDSDEVWMQTWSRLVLALNKGQFELGTGEGETDADIIYNWTGRFTAAVVAILPTEETTKTSLPEVLGYPEGALAIVKTNRFERDRRNRAAAIAIHGSKCKACGLEMGRRYGSIAAGMIEVHHVTPVSELGSDYVIDPLGDLVPLCPNCHAVAHRRNPPLSVRELQDLLSEK